jgi:hypothetical protein
LGLGFGLGRLGPGEEKKGGRESSWAEAAARPPTSLDRAEGAGERVKEFSPFYFLKSNLVMNFVNSITK